MSFWRNKPLIITCILLLVLVILLFATSGSNQPAGLQSVVGSIIAPVQEGMYNATSSISSFFGRMFSANDLSKENLELKEQVAELQSELRQYETVKSENERLRALLNVKDMVGKEVELVTAQVIGKTPGTWFTQFTVNVGAMDGVEKDMIVMSAQGLLGKVVWTSDTYSRIITLMDTTSGVPAVIERTRDDGVVKVNANASSEEGGLLTMRYLSTDSDVVPGDKVVTSGVGGLFPKGLYIGLVTEVISQEGSDKTVVVQSNVDFEHVEEVSIVKHVYMEVES